MLKKVLIGFSEQIAYIAGSASVNGFTAALYTAPFYLSRWALGFIIKPAVKNDCKSMINHVVDRAKDFQISAITCTIMNVVSRHLPVKGLWAMAILGAIRSAVISFRYNALSDQKDPYFPKNKLISDLARGATLSVAIGSSTILLSDYIIDCDNDPTKSSLSAMVLGGLVGEITFYYGLKGISRLSDNFSRSNSLAMKRQNLI